MTKHQNLRQQLQTRLDAILARVRKIEGDLRQSHDRDWTEAAVEVENDEVLEGLDEMSRAEVTSLREALRRMDTGRYGLCVQCGEAIGEERLDALPFAATCIYCAQK